MAKRVYEAPDIAISYDADVCQHAGNCTAGLPAVFDSAKRPWIQLEHATPEAIAAQVGRCPSGALQVERMGPAPA